MIERLILIGFMLSGKSTVGRLVAEELGWDFFDFDDAIERRTGKSIAEIFRDHGEKYFRALEAEVTREVADLRHAVLAPGGGWVTQPALVDALRPHSRFVWLRVGAETALERHEAQKRVQRPLLAVRDPLTTVRTLLSQRAPLYQMADFAVDTDGRAVKDVVDEVIRSLRPDVSSASAKGC